MPNRWEIWLAKVKFEDNPSVIKKRPVLIISPTVSCIISLKITGHSPRPSYKGEYRIKKWKEAGLDKESTIRVSKKLRLINTDFDYQIGRLQPIDIIEIQKLLCGSKN